MEVVEVKPDGHCLLNSVLECFKDFQDSDLTFHELVNEMKDQFQNNKDKYKLVLRDNPDDTDEMVYKKFRLTFRQYIEYKNWDNILLDIALLLIVNAFGIRVNVYTSIGITTFM